MRPELALVAAAALLVAAPAGADLGKLFHTPQERAQLDKLRRGEPVEAPAVAARKARITGFVRRSDGRNTVWINGSPVVVADPKAAELLEPGAVANGDDDIKVERAAPKPVKP
ncbi:MAG TPA: hypothetical protein VEC19_00500 [Usitatibacter sp.]|nr:hypothetical protein [Usitatibacter sp.]